MTISQYGIVRDVEYIKLCFSNWRGFYPSLDHPRQYTLNSIISTSFMLLPLLHPETLGNGCHGCSQFKFHSLLSYFPPLYHGCWHNNTPLKNWNHTLACITLSSLPLLQCWRWRYSIMSHAKLILFHYTFILTLHNSLNITCTLVATSVILQTIECNCKFISKERHITTMA